MTKPTHHRLLPKHRHSTTAMLTLALIGALATATSAQQATQPAEAQAGEATPDPEIAPRGQHMPRLIAYSEWRKLCFKAQGASPVCRTTANGTWPTGQTAVRVDVIQREGDDKARLQILLPVGLYLQAGVRATIDQGTWVRIPYVFCLTNLCVAGAPMSHALVRRMEEGHLLRLEVVDSNVLTIATSVPLKTFASARQGKASELFEQNLNRE